VNFLLHHHLAKRDLGSGAAGVGAMLPDLWRMADRRVRPTRHEPPQAPAGEATLAAVLDGVAHHLQVDAWFHRAPAFVDGEKLAMAELRSAGVQAPRMALLAHVIWEMCLDGALLRRQGLDPVLAELRADFTLTEEAAARAVELHHFERVQRSPEERAVFDARMQRLRDEVARGPWIEGYRDAAGLAVRVAGVRARLGMEPLSVDDHQRLIGALAPVAAAADGALADVVARRPRA
jgi:hypothetical protein